MKHDTAIPSDLHDRAAASVKDALGAFWSSVFSDQDLVEALIAARVLSAGQLHIDAMEALDLRDHAGSPVLHREHWHPLLVRLSKRNTASPLTVGMPDTPVLGPQDPAGEVYLPNEVFVVGGNAMYSKVNTYPIEGLGGCPLVRVATALCDSVARPAHVLSQGRDFALVGGTLVIRKEHDPFEAGGYRIVEDGDDSVAVLWACDAEFDRDYVSDFLGYPLGLHAPSTEAASGMLSALWDAVTLGLTPVGLNKILGAVFDVPLVDHDTVVESVTADGADSIVVTEDKVYRIETARLPKSEDGTSLALEAGSFLKAGSFLTDEIVTYWGLSPDDVADLHDRRLLGRIVLPPGSVAGVDAAVVIEPGARSVEDGCWFKLNDGDSADSPFWQAVFARTTEAERKALCLAMGATEGADGTVAGSVDPFKVVGPAVLANLILVHTSRSPVADPCAGSVLGFLHKLVPAYASLSLVQDVEASDGSDCFPLKEPDPPAEGEDIAPGATDDVTDQVVARYAASPALLNLFSFTAWAASASCSTATLDLLDVEKVDSNNDGVVDTMVLTDKTGYDHNLYTRYARAPFTAQFTPYAMPLPASTVLQFYGIAALTATAVAPLAGRSISLWWFYYDKDGAFIDDKTYDHSRSYKLKQDGGDTALDCTVVPPPEARYVTIFFSVFINKKDAAVRIRSIRVRRVLGLTMGDSVVSRFVPIDITEV